MSEAKKIGARIVLDGEQEFRQSINNSKTALKALDSELKLTQTQFKNQEKSLEALQATQKTYIKQQQALEKQEKTYVDQIEKASKAHDEATKSYKKTGEEIEALKKELESAKKEYGDSSEEVKKLSTELEKAESDYSKQGTAIANLETKQNKWQNELNNTRIQLTEVVQNLDETNRAIDNYGKEVDDVADYTDQASNATDKLGVSFANLVTADLVADVIRRIASAFVDMTKAVIETGSEFEKSMSNVAALSGATNDQLDALSEKAQQLGAKTMFSASQAADAFSYMALAGWDTNQMLQGIEPVLNLAAAADMDLAEASDIVTDYLTAFGLEAQDASKFTDQLAYAMANSNTDVEALGEAYKHCAAAAGSMNYSVEDVTGALMTMANAGVKGGEAGTSLRAIMINLATNVNGCADALEEYDVHVYDTEGNMNSLSQILVETAAAFEGFDDKQSNSMAKMIAGKTQYTGFQTVMLGLSEAAKENNQSLTDYAAALDTCDGYAKEMAKTMQDNLMGDITIMQSALDGLKIATYECFDEGMRSSVQAASDAFSILTDSVKTGELGTSLRDLGNSFSDMAEDLALLSESALPDLINSLTWIIEHREGLNTALNFVNPVGQSVDAVGDFYEGIKTLSAGAGELERHARDIASGYSETAVAFDKARFALSDLSDAERIEQEIALGQERLAELADERADAENRLAAAKERLADTKQYSWLGAETQEYQDAKYAVDVYQQSLDTLNTSYGDMQGQLLGLQAQQDLTSASMQVSADGLSLIGAEAQQTAGELYTMNEAFQESVADLQEAVAKTLESSNAIFDSTKEVEKQSIDEMKKNIEDHVNQITEWKDSYTELSSRVDDETGAVLSYLANMGVEGKGYIDEMLKLDDTELKEFTESMKEALTLPDTVASEVADSYTEAVKNAIDGMVGAANDASANNSEFRVAQNELADSLVEAMEDSWGENGENVGEIAEKAADAISEAIRSKTGDAELSAEGLTNIVNQVMQENMSYDTFLAYGKYVGDGLADGISAKEKKVRDAVAKLTEIAKSTTTTNLKIESPSKVFKQYGNYVGEGFEIGIEESMKKAVATLNETLPNEKNIELSSIQNVQVSGSNAGNGLLTDMVNMLSNYLPQLANMQIVMDTGATVGALTPGINNQLGMLNSRRV